MTAISVLDLVPVIEGGSVAAALDNAADLAAHAEALGFRRYWVAEHHAMPGIASSATSLVIARAGAATDSIRIGAGGIMLPNHAPLAIAEQFGTLEAMSPGRVDLGLGRAPGSDVAATRALRRNLATSADGFPNDVVELMRYFAGEAVDGVVAVPGAGADIEMWILGSSLYGARLAAILGLPYAFASHFAPDALDEALAIYRRDFQPSARLSKPYAMAGFNIFAADSTDEAKLLASSMEQAFVALRTGTPGRLKPPVPGYRDSLPPQLRGMLDHVLQATAIGAEEEVADAMRAFVQRTAVDELVVPCQMYDHAARRHSYTIAARAARRLGFDLDAGGAPLKACA